MIKLNKKLNEQLRIEKDSITLYNSFIKKIDDTNIKRKIIEVRNDEMEHCRLVKDLIFIARKYKQIKTSKIEKKTIDLTGFINKFNSLLVITSIDKYPSAIINLLMELKINCIYLSFNKLPRYMKNLLVDHNVDIKKIKFINCLNSNEEQDISINPQSLTNLSITLEKLMKEMKNKFFVLIDSISAFHIYYNQDIILRFISLINSELEESNAGIIWLSILNENGKELNSKISPLCDKTIKLK